jgi:hypothetical protein
MWVYESHLGGLYFKDERLSHLHSSVRLERHG